MRLARLAEMSPERGKKACSLKSYVFQVFRAKARS